MRFLLICAVSMVMVSSVALAVELIKPDKVPSNYATTVEKDGKQVVVFGSGPIAFEPKVFDQILSGYGPLRTQQPSNYATTGRRTARSKSCSRRAIPPELKLPPDPVGHSY
jgi:hypothetical protein